jgi:thiosulfate reductase cytochrome b subunit
MSVTYRLWATRYFATTVFLVLFLLAAPSPAAELENCDGCHEEVHVSSTVHSEIDCSECHPNIKQDPHEEENLQVLSGDQICLQCHDSASEIIASDHNELVCADCHGAAHDVAESDENVCADCHRRAVRIVGRSVHAGEVMCVDCHKSAHAVISGEDPNSPTAPVNQIQTCGACHQTPAEIIDGYLTSLHGKALLISALEDAPGCADCHGYHRATAVDDENSPTSHSNSPEMCGACHALTLSVFRELSAHGKAWEEGNEDAPVCMTCHESHGFVAPHDDDPRLGFVENCGDCHDEYYTTYRDSFHGKATGLDMAAAATCADCHESHKNLPAEDPGSSVHKDNLGETCGACHGETTSSFLSFDPHNDPKNRDDSAEVYFVWLFMTGLLLAVFGFFGIHDMLWLQRSLVGMARGEFKTNATTGPYVRRFSRIDIRLHLVVVLTFLLLAATGLPLKFHWMSWSQPLINLFGGLESARTIHRLAAIGTLAYVAFHLAHIFLRAARKERGLFWGFDSLVPQSQDIIDIARNVRYFLYLGPQPAGGKWTYWEKFDYMAVFWGIPIIGLSGLVLWYPNFFSQFVPGWVLNAAHVIHSEEALLATGFIFVFHFFHTHMRPETFPMDPVIFTGRIPLERFKEERPLEYQRLVDRDLLQSIITDPPSRAELRNAHIFGFTAIAVGIVLAFGIFWSIIFT